MGYHLLQTVFHIKEAIAYSLKVNRFSLEENIQVSLKKFAFLRKGNGFVCDNDLSGKSCEVQPSFVSTPLTSSLLLLCSVCSGSVEQMLHTNMNDDFCVLYLNWKVMKMV